MNWLNILKTSLISIKKNKFRSILTLLGIILGIACVATMYNIGLGFQDMVKDELKNLGTNVIIISEYTFTGRTRERSEPITINDLTAIEKECKEVSLAIPFIKNYTEISFRSNELSSNVVGTTPEYFMLGKKTLRAGSFFGMSDLKNASRVCVLGYDVSEGLFLSQNPIGKTIIINKIPFTVIGVLNEISGYSAIESGMPNNNIMIPYTTSLINFKKSWSQKPGSLNKAVIVVYPRENVYPVKEKILSILRSRYKVSKEQDVQFSVETLDEYAQFMKKHIDKQVIFLRVIALIALLIGGVNIMNIMLVSAKERTREIGVRMALGARSKDITFQFLAESVLLCFWGGIAGVVLSIPLSISLAKLINFAPKFSVGMVIIAFMYSGLTGIVFGVYPARKAASLDPIDALRYE